MFQFSVRIKHNKGQISLLNKYRHQLHPRLLLETTGNRLSNTFKTFYDKYSEVIEKYHVSFSDLVLDCDLYEFN